MKDAIINSKGHSAQFFKQCKLFEKANRQDSETFCKQTSLLFTGLTLIPTDL